MSRDVQKIESTGKGYKLFMVIGILLLIGGCGAGLTASNSPAGGTCFVIATVGGVIWLSARVLAWWNHG